MIQASPCMMLGRVPCIVLSSVVVWKFDSGFCELRIVNYTGFAQQAAMSAVRRLTRGALGLKPLLRPRSATRDSRHLLF